jgi:hypothetical protein
MSDAKMANITIEAGPMGLAIKVEYTGAIDTIPAAIERLRSAGVLDLVQTSKPTKAAQKPAQRVEPVYQPDGTACCPVHHKPLTEGRYGLYCPSRATGDQATNDKGYCSLKFAE